VNLLFLCLYSFLISPVSKYSSTHLFIDDLLQSKSSDKKYIYRVGQSRLDKISQQYYNSPFFGWLILQANPEFTGFEFNIPDGSVLTIPYPLVTSLQEYKSALDNYRFYYGK
jgi:hypothetical protein